MWLFGGLYWIVFFCWVLLLVMYYCSVGGEVVFDGVWLVVWEVVVVHVDEFRVVFDVLL